MIFFVVNTHKKNRILYSWNDNEKLYSIIVLVAKLINLWLWVQRMDINKFDKDERMYVEKRWRKKIKKECDKINCVIVEISMHWLFYLILLQSIMHFIKQSNKHDFHGFITKKGNRTKKKG